MCLLGRMLSLRAPYQTLAQLSLVLPDHRPALGQLSKTSPTLDSRACLLLVLELLAMMFGTPDINQREGAQPTTMEQAAPFLRTLQSLFETDHDGSDLSNLDMLSSGMTNNREDFKDRTDAPFNVDHLSQATATSPFRDHDRVGESIRTSTRAVIASIRQSL